MTKLLSSVAMAGALALFASAASADCVGDHNVTADAQSTKQTVAMSTYDGPAVPPVAEEEDKTAAVTCAEGDKDCTPATK